MIDQQLDLFMHRAASVVAGHIHERIRDSHSAQDPAIETGSIDVNGNLWPAQSHAAIPSSGYDIAPGLLAQKPDIATDEHVLFIWADSGRNRRPYVVEVLGAVHPIGETATINGDGTLTTAGGRIIVSTDWARTLSTTTLITGSRVVLVWADDGGLRKAYAVAGL